jgi:hypothetical protein
LLDLLEPGDVWEIIAQGHGKRVWRKTMFLPFIANIAVLVQQDIALILGDALQINTLYRLVR